jgi:uncharacterized membrane protein
VLILIIIGIGIFFIFAKENEKIVFKKIRQYSEIKPKKLDKKFLESLDKEERKVAELITEKGSIFQSKLVEKTGFNKVKITRILDSLEGKNIIERKRRGMTNIVILKH